VPFAFYSDHISDDLSWGIGVYAPFGLSSNYQNDWVGRYFADETSIKVVVLNKNKDKQIDVWNLNIPTSAKWSVLITKWELKDGEKEPESVWSRTINGVVAFVKTSNKKNQ
jgi:hypothetical protein